MHTATSHEASERRRSKRSTLLPACRPLNACSPLAPLALPTLPPPAALSMPPPLSAGDAAAQHAGTTAISPSFIPRSLETSSCSTRRITFGLHAAESSGAAFASWAPNCRAPTAAHAAGAADGSSCGSICSSSNAARASGALPLSSSVGTAAPATCDGRNSAALKRPMKQGWRQSCFCARASMRAPVTSLARSCASEPARQADVDSQPRASASSILA